MLVLIDTTDALLDPLDMAVRPGWIAAATNRLYPLLQRATFTTTTDELGVERPDEPARDIIRRAIGAQVAAWYRWEIDPTAPAGKARVQSTVSLGPASVSYDHRDGYAAEYAQVRDRIDPAAETLLRTLIRQPTY